MNMRIHSYIYTHACNIIRTAHLTVVPFEILISCINLSKSLCSQYVFNMPYKHLIISGIIYDGCYASDAHTYISYSVKLKSSSLHIYTYVSFALFLLLAGQHTWYIFSMQHFGAPQLLICGQAMWLQTPAELSTLYNNTMHGVCAMQL